jgi:hypothetical protein
MVPEEVTYGDIDAVAGMRRHHVKYRVLGGVDKARNILMVPEPDHRPAHPGWGVKNPQVPRGTFFY